MDATTQDLLMTVAGALAIMLLTATAVWLLSKTAAAKVAPVGLLLAGFCLEIFLTKQPYLQIGLQIYPNDVISIVALLATVVGFAYRPLPVYNSAFLLWLAFGVTIIASFIVGLNTYGRNAGAEVRPFFYLWVAGLYCTAADFNEADLRRIGRWCVWTAYALIGIAAYYWIAVETGFVDRKGLFDADDETYVFRPVGAHAALVLALVGLVQTMAWLRGSGTRFSGMHAALFLAFVVLIQHRSVWVATVVGLLAIFVLERRHLPRRFALLLAFTLSLTLGLAVAGASGALDDLARRLVESIRSMDDNVGTFSGRVDGWVRLLENWWQASTATQLFGFPFGHGYTRQYRGVVVEWAPHNYYIDLLLRVGIVGAAFFLIPTAMAIAHGFRAKCTTEFEYLLTRGLGVALLAAMVYCIAYPSNYLLSAATGVALAHLIRHQQTRGSRSSALKPVRSPVTGQIIGWRGER